MKNKHGFSLVEVMITLGIVGISMLAVSTLMVNSTRSVVSTGTSTDFINLISTVSGLIGSDSACTSALNLSAAPIAVSSLPASPAVRIYTNNGGTIIAQSNSNYGSIRIGNLRLVLLSTTPVTLPNGSRVYQATLNINATRNGLPALSNSTLVLNLTTDTSGTNVISCSGMRNGNGSSLPVCASGQTLTSNDGIRFTCSDIIPENAGATAGGACTVDGSASHNASGLFLCHGGTWQQYTQRPRGCDGVTASLNFSSWSEVTVGGVTFCRLVYTIPARTSFPNCPPGMHQFRDWSTTISRNCSGTTTTMCTDPRSSCSTGAHAWNSAPLEVCNYSSTTYSVSSGCSVSWATCATTYTEIGCIHD